MSWGKVVIGELKPVVSVASMRSRLMIRGTNPFPSADYRATSRFNEAPAYESGKAEEREEDCVRSLVSGYKVNRFN